MFQQPDTRPTAKAKKGKDGKEHPPTIPMVDRVMVKPWDKKGGAVAATPGTDDTALKAKAVDLIKQVLAGNPAGLDRQTVAVQVFQKADSDQTALVTLISNNDAFVGGIEGVVFDNNVLKLA